MTDEIAVIDPADTEALETLDPATREIAITQLLTHAQQYMAVAMKQPEAPRLMADFKAQIVAVAEFAKQKRVSEEIQIDATVMVRRSERALGVAIREGQERGTVHTSSTAAKDRELIKAGVLHEKSCPSTTDFATRTELYGGSSPGGGILGMADDVSSDEFDVALGVAKDERNLSRVNVVRKIREVKGDAVPEAAKVGRPTANAPILDRATHSLYGLRIALRDIKTLEPTNPDKTKQWVQEINDTIRELKRVRTIITTNTNGETK